MFTTLSLKQKTGILVFTHIVAGALFCVPLAMLQTRHNRGILAESAARNKKLQTCRTVLASQDSQVATDLMKMTAQINGITKRLKTMASLLHRDAEIVNEVKWFVQYSKRLEEQGMVGCTYRRTKRGKLRKCEPKFNLSECKKDKYEWICPTPAPPVVKRKRKKRRRRK